MKKKNTKNVTARNKASSAFSKWQTLIEKEYKACKLKRTGTKKAVDKVMWLSLSLLCASIVLIVIGAMIGTDEAAAGPALLFLISMGALIWSSTSAQNMLNDNEKAIEHIEKWKGFKRFLKDFSKLDEKDYGSIVIWEHYLVYAIGLGVADKVLEQLKDIYPEITTLDDTYSGIYHSSSYHSFSNSFNSASTGAFTYSSSTGSGGGFSGGGGGRWRRWRWWRVLIHITKF